MKYLIDSDYVADYLSARPQATELLIALTKEGTTISLITFGEIYEGIYYGHNPQKTKDVFNRFLRSVDILPMTKPIMQRFAQIRGGLRRTGNIIGDFDILIAATALSHNLTLVTRNIKDYQRIPNLSIYKAG